MWKCPDTSSMKHSNLNVLIKTNKVHAGPEERKEEQREFCC